MARKSKFPVMPALIGIGIYLLLKKRNPPPRTVNYDQAPATQSATSIKPAKDETAMAIRSQL